MDATGIIFRILITEGTHADCKGALSLRDGIVVVYLFRDEVMLLMRFEQ